MLCQAPGTRIINNIITRNYYFTGSGFLGGGIQDSAGCGVSPGLVIGYNDVWANFGDGNYDNVDPGPGAMGENPQFVGGAGLLAAYHLRPTSPVKAAGSVSWAPAYDVDGDPRGTLRHGLHGRRRGIVPRVSAGDQAALSCQLAQ